jgi:hypothetical protein
MPAPQAALPARTTAPTRALLGEQTAGTLLSNIVHLYRHHFGVVFWTCLLPVAPFLLFSQLVDALAPSWSLLGALPYTAVAFLATAALTVVLADLCLGQRPTVRRAYTRVFAQHRWWQVLSTGLLVTVAIWLGFLLLVLPGVWLMVRSVFAAAVVTLEGRSGRAAIRRSFDLTRGQAWRLAGLTLLPTLFAYALGILVAFVLGASIALGDFESTWVEHLLMSLAYMTMLALLFPTVAATVVLLYYDQRARRESYDVQALSEDLMR